MELQPDYLRRDLIEDLQLTADQKGLTYYIREIVPYSDNTWMAQSLYMFFPQYYEELQQIRKLPVLFPLICNVTDRHWLDQLASCGMYPYDGLNHTELIFKITGLDQEQSPDPSSDPVPFYSLDELWEFIKDHPHFTIFPDDKKIPQFMMRLIYKYFLFLQPNATKRLVLNNEHTLQSVLYLHLSSEQALQLYHTINLSNWNFEKLRFSILEKVYKKYFEVYSILKTD